MCSNISPGVGQKVPTRCKWAFFLTVFYVSGPLLLLRGRERDDEREGEGEREPSTPTSTESAFRSPFVPGGSPTLDPVRSLSSMEMKQLLLFRGVVYGRRSSLLIQNLWVTVTLQGPLLYEHTCAKLFRAKGGGHTYVSLSNGTTRIHTVSSQWWEVASTFCQSFRGLT